MNRLIHMYVRRARAARNMIPVALVASMFAVVGCGGSGQKQAYSASAPAVSLAPAVQKAVTDTEEFSGRLEATEFVELRPRVSGVIDRIHFLDGGLIKKGALMFSIDPRPFQAEAARASSALSAAKARAELAQSEVGRAQRLLDSNAVSRQDFDQLTSGLSTSKADIEGAEAALRIARLNLAYAQVRAPVSGRASRANVTAGNLVNEQTVLTTIAGIENVYAYFEGSEQTYLRMTSGAGTGAPVIFMGLANEPDLPHRGTVDFVDNRLDPQTGAIRMRARFDNSDGKFTPGLSVKLKMESAASHDAVLVPEQAIGTDQTKKFVYVVGTDGQPQFREVTLGALRGSMRVIENAALKPGENVIVDGMQRVIPGVPVASQILKVDDEGMPISPPPSAHGAGATADTASASH